jgi:hypothetical protein
MGTKRQPPELIYRRERSANPGSAEQLERILRRWGHMLIQKARQRLADRAQSEAGMYISF